MALVKKHQHINKTTLVATFCFLVIILQKLNNIKVYNWVHSLFNTERDISMYLHFLLWKRKYGVQIEINNNLMSVVVAPLKKS